MPVSFAGPITHEQLVALGLDSATHPTYAVVDGKVIRANPKVRAVKLSVLLRREAAAQRKRTVAAKSPGGKLLGASIGQATKRKLAQPKKR
jgi:hypothetical protein